MKVIDIWSSAWHLAGIHMSANHEKHSPFWNEFCTWKKSFFVPPFLFLNQSTYTCRNKKVNLQMPREQCPCCKREEKLNRKKEQTKHLKSNLPVCVNFQLPLKWGYALPWVCTRQTEFSLLDLEKAWHFLAMTQEGRRGEGRKHEQRGTTLQYACLENPMDGGAWWAAVHGVAKSRTRLSDFTFTFHFHALRRKWQPTPVFLPGESQGRGSLVGCHLWGHTESDMTEAT